ncbi:MAG: glycosyltransferase family 2 protein [Syntrophomonadaceae bacterium]|nr:glycosyltransferase family 2 protein [Syntrophomonadaceae bacterium]
MNLDNSSPGVSIITCTNRPLYIEAVFGNYLRQNYSPKELIVVLNRNDMQLAKWQDYARNIPGVTILRKDETVSLGDCSNYAVEHASFDYVAKFDDDDYYAPNFLADEMKGFEYSQADIIGKSTRFIYFADQTILGLCEPSSQYTYVTYVVGSTMIIKKEIFDTVKFRSVNIGEDSDFQRECLEKGLKIFSVDKFNYATIRHHKTNPHTYPLSDEDYLSYCSTIWKTSDYQSIVIR